MRQRRHGVEAFCLSRHGLRSRGHGVVARKSEADFAAAPATTALALLRRIRAAVAADLEADRIIAQARKINRALLIFVLLVAVADCGIPLGDRR